MIRSRGRPRTLPALPQLVRHDDADREFAYHDGAEDALAWTHDRGFVVSMRDDWSTVFGPDA